MTEGWGGGVNSQPPPFFQAHLSLLHTRAKFEKIRNGKK